MTRMVVRLRNQADYARCLALIQQFELDALELEQFDIQMFEYRDFQFLHKLLRDLKCHIAWLLAMTFNLWSDVSWHLVILTP